MSETTPSGDPVASLIPWYANGSLAPEEREHVERHLATCATCRELLERATEMRRLAPRLDPAACLEHVHPRLLTRYAEEPGSLEPETVRWIEARLDACATCRAAVERLHEVARSIESAESRPTVVPARRSSPARAAASLWELLAATVLRPAPALVYLLVLTLVVPAWWLARRAGEPAGDAVVRPVTIRLTGESATRSEPGETGGAPPAEIAWRGSDGWILLELVTDLAPEDLPPGAGFVLELRRGESLLWSARRDGADFSLRGGRAVLTEMLRPGGLRTGAEHEILLRAVAPGDPLDGQALFRRSFRVSEE